MKQLQNKETIAADYLAISPVLNTPTKNNTVIEWGFEGIKTIRKLTTKPLIAIGGMNPGNVQQVIEAGADCIAVVSAICAANDPAEAANKFRSEILKSL